MKSNPIGFEYASLDVESYALRPEEMHCIALSQYIILYYTPLQKGGKETDMEN